MSVLEPGKLQVLATAVTENLMVGAPPRDLGNAFGMMGPVGALFAGIERVLGNNGPGMGMGPSANIGNIAPMIPKF